MKKFLLLFLLPFLGFAQFPEDFSSGIPSTWAVFDGANGEGRDVTWTGVDGTAFCASQPAETLAQDWLVTPAVTITSTSNILYFRARDWSATDFGSTFYIKVSTQSQDDTSTFTDRIFFTEVNFAHGSTLGEFSIDMNRYLGQTIYIAFVVEQNNGDSFTIDDVQLKANEIAPNAATTPSPVNGARSVGLLQTDTNGDGLPDNRVVLSWVPNTIGDAPDAYIVYFGTDPADLIYLGETYNTSLSILGLSFSTKYYWKIIPFNGGGPATNAMTWNFTTRTPILGTDESLTDSKSTFVYPNPAKDIVSIKLSNKFNANSTKVTVLDMTGKAITSFDTVKDVDVRKLQKGVYILQITDGTNTETKKLIKE